MQPMRYLVLHLLAIGAYVSAKKQHEDEITEWSSRLKSLLKDCPSSSSETVFLQALRDCLQSRTLSTLDVLFDNDVIPLTDGIDLVRFTIDQNSTNKNTNSNETLGDTERSDVGWGGIVFNRLSRIFRTHVVKIDFDALANSASYSVFDKKADEARGRRRRRMQIMPLMVMGLLLMGSVLIPMGFQFLAVLGGKALLLAKMALILSSIQGLKKIATNGVNYGLYHSPDQWHDRSHSEAPSIYDVPPFPHYHHP